MPIDHIFCFVASESEAEEAVARMGLVESYRRIHPGQGTANICCAFDNLYLELLWLTSADEASSLLVRRMGLLERSQWAQAGTCPFGIAWRGPTEPPPDLPTWDYRPSYLPPELAITVAVDSDDHRRPLMFTFPGTTEPSAWPPERRRALQHTKGLGRIGEIEISMPADVGHSAILDWLGKGALLHSRSSGDGRFRLRMIAHDLEDAPTAELSLPDMTRSEIRTQEREQV